MRCWQPQPGQTLHVTAQSRLQVAYLQATSRAGCRSGTLRVEGCVG
jgi:hypothetical protein